MKILVVGSGVVGFATGDGLIRYGNDVTFCDIDPARREWLFAHDYVAIDKPDLMEDIDDYDVVFIATKEQNVEAALKDILDAYASLNFRLIVIRSSVAPGTTSKLSEKYGVHLCHNPEFLTEAQSQWDFLNPGRIVIGECCKEHGDILEQLYTPFHAPIIRTSPTTTEMVKLATNACFSTMISFWNEIKTICDSLNINSTEVGAIVCKDSRISNYGARFHGRPFGGHCLPKDLDQLIDIAKDAPLLRAVKKVNLKAGTPCK